MMMTTSVGLVCLTCNGTDCNESPGTNTGEVCEGSCWAYLLVSSEGHYGMRGCDLNFTSFMQSRGYSGNADMSCTDDRASDEICMDLADGDQHCMRCCDDSDSCNSWVLEAFEEDDSAGIAIKPLLITTFMTAVALAVI